MDGKTSLKKPPLPPTTKLKAIISSVHYFQKRVPNQQGWEEEKKTREAVAMTCEVPKVGALD